MKKIKLCFYILLTCCFIFCFSCGSGNPDAADDTATNEDSEESFKITPIGPYTVECSELDSFLAGLEENSETTPYEIIVSHPVRGEVESALYNNRYKYVILSFINYDEYDVMEDFYGLFSLVKITIPKNVKEIHDGYDTNNNKAFSFCMNLVSIEVEEENTLYKSIDGVLYYNNGRYLVRYPGGKRDKTFTIADTAEGSPSMSVDFNSYIETIVIPESFYDIGFFNFTGCSNLKEFKTKSNTIGAAEHLINIDGVLVDNSTTDPVTLLSYPANKAGDVYTVPSGIKRIGMYAFDSNQNLTKIIMNEGVTVIRTNAFASCKKLTSVVLPSSITIIDDSIFYECKKLTTVYYKGSEEQWNLIDIDSRWLKDAPVTPQIVYNYSE